MVADPILKDRTDVFWFIRRMATLPRVRPPRMVSEYVQGKRVLPSNSPAPGPWNNAKTPYLVEIMDNLSPYSSVQHTVVMKGAQIGVTAAAENVVGFWMDAHPTEILYVSATESLLAKWGAKRLEPLIDSLGLRSKLAAPTENVKSRRTGDLTLSKQFPGGSLSMASAQSAPSLRSDTIRVLIRDEIDGAPAQLVTGEGNWMDVSWARTSAWGSLKRVLDLSTPTTSDGSNVYQEFLKGDQRKYHVPCPHCGHLQPLVMAEPGGDVGLVPIFGEGQRLVGAEYHCAAPECGKVFYDHQKPEFLLCEELGGKAKWIPTADASDPGVRSYQISAIYSPFMSWREVWATALRAEGNVDGQRSFTNLVLGMPFTEKGSRPKLQDVLTNVGDYTRGSVPEGVLFVTLGCDVQTGKDPRVEVEILGHGLDYRTWVIDWKVFSGPIADPWGGAWGEFADWVEGGGLRFTRTDGKAVAAQAVFIDSGDGNTTSTVYQFCARWPGFFPCKGQGFIRYKSTADKKDRADVPGASDFKKYRASQIGQSGQFLVLISTNFYKRLLYRNLAIFRIDADVQRPGFVETPIDLPEAFYKELLSEELRSDGSFIKTKSSQRNEALDCTVYALAAADFWLEARVQEARDGYRKQGYAPMQVATINGRWALEALARGIDRQSQRAAPQEV